MKNEYLKYCTPNQDYLKQNRMENTEKYRIIDNEGNEVLSDVSGQVCGTCGSKDVTDWNTYFRCNECDSRC